MSFGSKLLRIAVIAGPAVLVWAPAGVAQDNICAAKDKRQACSFECCGRRSCPPSCEVDCVKLCVDACSSPAQLTAFSSRKRELQIRCGNKSVR